jgi:hypothetical protein
MLFDNTHDTCCRDQTKKESKPHAKFSQSDDKQLRAAVAHCGSRDWKIIADLVEGKNERQCRERWFNYLCPSLNTEPWTSDQDALLLQKQTELGNKWVKIAHFFPNRTDAMVKNRFGQLQRKAKKMRRTNIADSFEDQELSPISTEVTDFDLFWSISCDSPCQFQCTDDDFLD